MELEKKTMPFELKSDDGTGIIEGYGSTFGGEPDACNDVVAQGAFAKSLIERPNIKLLFGHDWNQVIGKLTEVYEDAKGLHFKAKISQTERGKEVLQLIKDGVLDKTSIGYTTQKATYREDGVRVLEELKLYELSVVPFPANENASITGAKQMDAAQQKAFDELKSTVDELKTAVEALNTTPEPQKNEDDPQDVEEKSALEALLQAMKTQ